MEKQASSYAQTGEIRKSYYRQFAPIVAAVAEGFGAPLSSQTIDRQTHAWVAMMYIDTVVDRGLTSERSATMQWLEGIAHNHPAADGAVNPELAAAVQALVERCSGEQILQFYTLGCRTVRLSRTFRTETDPVRYCLRRTQEGRISADMLDAVVDPDERSRPAHQRYAKAMRRFYGATNLVDSFFDMGQDFRAGELGMRPTVRNRLVVGAYALSETIAGFRMLGWSSFRMLWALKAFRVPLLQKTVLLKGEAEES